MRTITHYYHRERSRGRFYSAVLHLLFILLAIFGLPEFLSPRPPEEPVAITVDILPVTGITNVKPSETPPEKENKPDEKKAEQKKPAPPVKTAEATPPPPEPAPADKPKEKPKEEKKEKEKPKEEKKKKEEKKPAKPKVDPLAAILKSVKETAQKENKEKPKEKPKEENTSPSRSLSSQYNPNLPMSMSEKDAIMSQLAKCWNVPAGAKDAQNLSVVLYAEYNVDGSYVRVELSKASLLRYQTDSFFRAAADSAIRAVKECSPLKDLPPQKYDTWKVMELNFDPKFMLN